MLAQLKHAAIFPASHYAVEADRMKSALQNIARDLDERVKFFEMQGKQIEAYRIRQRTEYDMDMMREIGYCSGIENYSRYFDGRAPGQPAVYSARLFSRRFHNVYRRESYESAAASRNV